MELRPILLPLPLLDLEDDLAALEVHAQHHRRALGRQVGTILKERWAFVRYKGLPIDFWACSVIIYGFLENKCTVPGPLFSTYYVVKKGQANT